MQLFHRNQKRKYVIEVSVTTAFFILVEIKQHITRTLSKKKMENGYVV